MQSYTDILLDKDGDLFPEQGEAIGEARYQDVWQMLRLTKGGLTHAPWMGGNLMRFVQTNDAAGLKQHIKLEMRKANIEISNDEINDIVKQLIEQ